MEKVWVDSRAFLLRLRERSSPFFFSSRPCFFLIVLESWSLGVAFFSTPRTMVSVPRTPMAALPLQTASRVYSGSITSSPTPMGNFASCWTPDGGGGKVVLSDGTIHEFDRPISAAELMLEYPRQFVVDIKSLSVGSTKVTPLPADHTLDPDKAYLMLPMTQGKVSADVARRILSLAGSVPRSRSLPRLAKNISLVPGICMAGVGVRGLVGDDVDEEFRLGIELALVREALEPDLVPSIGGVADKLAEEDLLVGVEGVDDKTEELVPLGLERQGLFLRCHHPRSRKQGRNETVPPIPPCSEIVGDEGREEKARA